MFCSISGNAPESPVVSKITGHVYEKSLLEKYLVAEGKVCPPILFLFRAAGRWLLLRAGGRLTARQPYAVPGHQGGDDDGRCR